MKCSFVSLIFLKRSLVFPILLFSFISLHCSLRKACLSLLANLGILHFISDQISRSVMSDSLRPHESQHARPPCCWVTSVVSDSVWPHRRQPTRLPRPWDSPGKNTGVGYHFLLQCMKVKSESEVAQSCPTLSNPMDCSLQGSSVHGIFQARVLEWGAIAFSDLGT